MHGLLSKQIVKLVCQPLKNFAAFFFFFFFEKNHVNVFVQVSSIWPFTPCRNTILWYILRIAIVNKACIHIILKKTLNILQISNNNEVDKCLENLNMFLCIQWKIAFCLHFFLPLKLFCWILQNVKKILL